MTAQQVIERVEIHPNNIVKLPQVQLDRKVYEEVAKKLQGIGGSWKGGKIAGFVFPHDPTERIAQLKGGEVVNLKKDFQFFETPETLANQLVKLANVSDGDRVLEPSAGRGAIIQAIRRKSADCHISAVELMPENAAFLKGKKLAWSIVFDEGDFLEWDEGARQFDKIIANPPFSKNQDIDHVLKMWEHLAVGGRLVSVMSSHWQLSENRKERDFRNWIDEVGAEIFELKPGTFSDSGTKVSSVILFANKG